MSISINHQHHQAQAKCSQAFCHNVNVFKINCAGRADENEDDRVARDEAADDDADEQVILSVVSIEMSTCPSRGCALCSHSPIYVIPAR